MRIGIDFDRVLFDTDRFNDYMKNNIEGLVHVDTSPYDEHGNYSPEIHAELCGIPVEKVYEALEDLERFVYDDIEKLEQLSEHDLIIVTRGRKKFQETKIQNSGVKNFFDQVVVVEEGDKDVKDIDFLVDDREAELVEAGLPIQWKTL
ncbi:MAG: hypothetical protein ABEJ72_10495 [Candidatus Aenigmatarchaeota archaeon]